MGDGEAYLDEYRQWYVRLGGGDRRSIQARYPASGAWRDFYLLINARSANEVCADAVLGALVGDSIGVPFEFMTPERLPATNTINMVMPEGFAKTYEKIPYGTWSDDSSQLLCLLEVLTKSDDADLDVGRFGGLLLRWMQSTHHQAGGVVYDCGGQTARSLKRIGQGVHATKAGGENEHSNGNGSLMRCLPVALIANLQGWTQSQMIEAALVQSVVTHAHPLAQVCCAVYCLMAETLLAKPGTEVAACCSGACDILRHHFIGLGQSSHLSALARIADFPASNFRRGSGFVLDSLWTAIECLDSSSCYVDVVRKAISYGNDTDTTACIAGGLAGIRYGLDHGPLADNPIGIPIDWVAALAIPAESLALLREVFGDVAVGRAIALT
jgi:ADP-ribosyl-[dinitrogen reductase] hydrolase